MHPSPLSFAKSEWARYCALMDAAYDPANVAFIPFTDEQMTAHHIRDAYWDDA